MANFITNILKRDAETQPILVSSPESNGLVPMSPSSKVTNYISPLLFNRKDNYNALKLSAVYAAISIISNSIASLPIYVKQRKDNAATILENNYIQKLFYNMLQSKHAVIKQVVWDLILWGNAFIYIKRKDGRPEQLIYLEHGDVQVNYRKEYDKVEYNVCNHMSIPNKVNQEDMLHFAKDTYDGINGRGFIVFASDIINLAGFTQLAALKFFSSGCNLPGILKFKGRLTDKQKSDIRSQWMQIHGSEGGGIGVLEGDADYESISQNSADSQMLETRQYNVEEIARFFNISPVLLGDLSHSSYNDIEQCQIEFVTHTLLPIINLLEDEINRKLITSRNQYIDFDENALMKGNMSTLANYYSTMVSNAIYTHNECRKALGLNPIDGGDELVLPFTKISDNIINESNTVQSYDENDAEEV